MTTITHLRPSERTMNAARYRAVADGAVVELEISYQRGSSPRKRGIYVFVREGTITGGVAITDVLSGHRCRVRALERASPAILQHAVEAADARAAEVTAAYRADPHGNGKRVFDDLARDLTTALSTIRE